MGLSFFQGNRTTTKKTGGRNVGRKKNNTDAATTPAAPATDYQQFSTPSSPISNPSIPVAVPIAYVPPPTSPSSAPHQQQQQQQHIVPTSNAGAAPTNSHSAGGRLGNRYHATAMTIANKELDHNIRLGLRSTFGGRTLLHKAFIVLSILTILTAINNIIAHTLSLLIYGRYEDPMEQILRVFTIGWYFLVILIETNRSALVQQSFVFQHWAARGILYVFLGVLSAVEYDVGSQNYGSYRDRYNRYSYGQRNFVIYIPSGEDAFELYVFATGITMLFIGLVYTILGACCLHERYQRLQAQFEQRQRLATTGQQPSFPSDHKYP
ncbi:COPI associated protein [Nitzschia inconspicua]|uniref:COPI associated protein n=1 Tax=Nitzschia inconspicua TaxID=303405 RepID=A0A9K3KAB1_9STRA|nr:COPI associated protein [Nitzschia inconspicua]